MNASIFELSFNFSLIKICGFVVYYKAYFHNYVVCTLDTCILPHFPHTIYLHLSWKINIFKGFSLISLSNFLDVFFTYYIGSYLFHIFLKKVFLGLYLICFASLRFSSRLFFSILVSLINTLFLYLLWLWKLDLNGVIMFY